MGFLGVLKGIAIPAVIAGAIYALLVYVLIPFYRNHRPGYSQYLPLDTLSNRTSDFRTRVSGAMQRFFLPAHMRWQQELTSGRYGYGDNERGSGSGDEQLIFGEEEGESMVGFDVDRRERSVRPGRVDEIDSERRLSRDLEEGFRDSDDEEEDSRGDGHRR